MYAAKKSGSNRKSVYLLGTNGDVVLAAKRANDKLRALRRNAECWNVTLVFTLHRTQCSEYSGVSNRIQLLNDLKKSVTFPLKFTSFLNIFSHLTDFFSTSRTVSLAHSDVTCIYDICKYRN